jgi:hypothetical protein
VLSASVTTHECIRRYLPETADEMTHVYEGELVDPTDFLPTSLRHYQYHGSLTTPPCSETVTWSVLASALTMSAERPMRSGRSRCTYPASIRSRPRIHIEWRAAVTGYRTRRLPHPASLPEIASQGFNYAVGTASQNLL